MSMTRGVAISCVVVSLSVVGHARAQAPGQIPVFVDASGTLGNSTIAQTSDGNILLTNPTSSGPVLWVYGGGANGTGIIGHNPTGIGIWGSSASSNAIGVYGENYSGGVAVWGNGRAGGVGVYGDAGSGGGTGVVGAATGGYAARFIGPVGLYDIPGGGDQPLCRDSAFGTIGTCFGSSLRYKTDVHPFSSGLDIVNRLRPIAFTWKQGERQDVGLAAEEVEKVEPLLTFRNEKGEIEGVKYNQLSAVFVNAINEQQAQIKRQQEQIDAQQRELTAFKALVCASHPDADVCR